MFLIKLSMVLMIRSLYKVKISNEEANMYEKVVFLNYKLKK